VRFRPPPVSTLLWWDGRLVVGGDFAKPGTVAATNIAIWKDGVWSALGGGLPSALGLAPPPAVAALAIDNELLYAGGSFNRVAGGVAQGLAAWDGSKWQAFAEGVDRGRFSSPLVRTLAMVNGNLFVGGHFKFVGTRPSSGLAVRHGPPRLVMERSPAGTMHIRWPSWADDYVLESAHQLESADWELVEGVGSETIWQVQPTTPETIPHFYRLKRRP